MIVLDASIVVELLTNGPLADSIRSELTAPDESFIVPHPIVVEVMSAMRSLLLAGGSMLTATGNSSQDSRFPAEGIRTCH